MSRRRTSSWSEREREPLESRLSIEPDGTVVARSGKVEYGQGIRTGFAHIIAEALDVPLERVRIQLGETDEVPWDMGTFGSLSTATDGKTLREAAVFARQLLLERAARYFDVPDSQLQIVGGQVRTGDGRTVAYEALTADEPLTGSIPELGPDIKTGSFSKSSADVPNRLEAFDIVMGRARYAADVRLPGMLRGRVLHPPVLGSRLVSVDDSEARAMPGVVEVVRDHAFVGVVAERDEQAQAAIAALKVEWALPEADKAPSFDSLLRNDENFDSAFSAGTNRFEARYHLPHISHATIGPSAAVADVCDDGADLYVSTQRPFGLRDEVAELLQVSANQVHVHPQMMGGMYGRGNMNDAPLDSVRLSRAVRKPVLVQWTRTDEFRLSPHRPVLEADTSAVLDDDGRIAAWKYHARTNRHTYGWGPVPDYVVAMTSGRNAIPAYRLGCAQVRLQVLPTPLRTGAFRSLAASQNIFAIESFMDELAHASGQDPIAFRLRHIDDPRLRKVLEIAAQLSEWSTRPHQDGQGLGVACAIYHGTYVAEVAEVAVEPGGKPRIKQVWCAVDCGHLVHPDGARNQIEGGVQQAASWTLLEELHHQDGAVTTSSFLDYPIATVYDAPDAIHVTFVDDPSVASTGVGEPGSVPTAAAIANAVFDACGARVRCLPLSADAVISAHSTGGA